MRNIIIKDYISSLKEDKELDYIFTLLLENMDFQIVSTPHNTRGQTQYGKDVVATGKDENGRMWKWYFIIKGHAAKDINSYNFNSPDGIRESLLVAKDVDFESYSIPGFNKLPTKFVVVHNGTMLDNTRVQFEDLIKKYFEEETVEEWNIEKLTRLFSKYLFNECLFADEESFLLMKRVLVLLDSSNFSSLQQLVHIQFERSKDVSDIKSRIVAKLFSSLTLICLLVNQYAHEYNNLTPSKYCVDLIVIKTWEFIVKKGWEKEKHITNKFCKLIDLQVSIYFEYINKTYPLASAKKGLFTYGESQTEPVCYPIRCFKYLDTLLYFSFLTETHCKPESRTDLRKRNIQYIERLIEANSGFDMTLLDTNSISLLYLTLYITGGDYCDDDMIFLGNYFSRIIQNIIIRLRRNKMLPETYGNEKAVAHSIYAKSNDYVDDSSLLLFYLATIVSMMELDELYQLIVKIAEESNVNIQRIAPINIEDVETKLFEGNMNDNIKIQMSLSLPNTIQEFLAMYPIGAYKKINFKCDNIGLPYIKLLAHMYYNIDVFLHEIFGKS